MTRGRQSAKAMVNSAQDLAQYTRESDRMVIRLSSEVVEFAPSPFLGEGRGEGLVQQARNNSPGFSPLSSRATSQCFNTADAAKNSLTDLRAEARRTIVVAVSAQALSPPSPKGEGVKLYPTVMGRSETERERAPHFFRVTGPLLSLTKSFCVWWGSDFPTSRNREHCRP